MEGIRSMRSACSVAIATALTATAVAQPAPVKQLPASGTQPQPDATPSASVPTGDTATPTPTPNGDTTTGETTVPTTGETIAPTPPPPPPPPPPVPRLLASSAVDQQMFAHDRALDRETLLPDHQFTASVFADYWFQSGPRIGGGFGVYRSFEFYLGAMLDSVTTGGGGVPEMSSSSTRFMYGGNVGMLSYAGVQLSGGIMCLLGNGDTAEITPTGALSSIAPR